MLIIPLQDVENQIVSCTLNGQSCKIRAYQKRTGFYCDLLVDDTLIIGGVICQDANRIVRDAYLGFVGDLVFLDTFGSADPSYPGIGTRYQLAYLFPGEY